MPPRTRKPKPPAKRRYATARQVEKAAREGFHEMAHSQRCCQACDAEGPYESHHVVERRELRRVGRLDLIWDRRNCMRLCPDCHRRHTNRSKPLEMRLLFDMHFEFAFYVLGAAAYSYLDRSYAGHDQRLNYHLTRWEEEHAGTS